MDTVVEERRGRRTARHAAGGRRSQEIRRAETQSAVLDATVDCLAKLGYAQTTITRIARRARVSRGALLHYYTSKAELLASALERILERRTTEFREAFARARSDTAPGAAAIDILWSMFSSSTFDAWLELLVASRSDRELRAHVQRVAERFAADVLATYRALFPVPAEPSPQFELVPAFAFAFLEGLALQRIALADAQQLPQLIEMFKGLEGIVFGPRKEQS